MIYKSLPWDSGLDRPHWRIGKRYGLLHSASAYQNPVTPDRRQWKTHLRIDNARSKIDRDSVLIAYNMQAKILFLTQFMPIDYMQSKTLPLKRFWPAIANYISDVDCSLSCATKKALKRLLRGLLFKFVDFLYSRSEDFDRVIGYIIGKYILFPFLMYKA